MGCGYALDRVVAVLALEGLDGFVALISINIFLQSLIIFVLQRSGVNLFVGLAIIAVL